VFRFHIAGPDGDTITRFASLHERDLHLVVVSRELSVYRHLHPDLADDGTWSVSVPALVPGSYRAIADFQVADGPHLVLGADLSVAGEYRPQPVAEPTTATSVDGYDVTLGVEPRGGEGSGTLDVVLRVSRGGRPVADLEPYLGARGHLVAIHAGDLAYAHVHPIESDDEPGVVRFDAELPTAGRYGLFFDFQHEGAVHTASFTFDQGLVTGIPSMEH
jgi:hypothetical protein